jgi:hypothetical protein
LAPALIVSPALITPVLVILSTPEPLSPHGVEYDNVAPSPLALIDTVISSPSSIAILIKSLVPLSFS